MVTGFIRLNGMTVGVVANRSKVYNAEAEVEAEFDSVLTVDGCKKATDFVNFCDAFSIPVLTLTNVTGFAATVESEKNMASAVAKLTYAFANATVPKVNVIVGKAFGSAYVSMNSKSIGADLVYAWPTAEIGMWMRSLQHRSCTQTQMLRLLMRKQLNTKNFSQARIQQQQEDMLMRSSSRQIQENM